MSALPYQRDGQGPTLNFSTLRLRPYQEEAQQAIVEARKRGFRAQLVSLATGLGKSVIIATLPELLELRPTDVTLVVAHRDELIQQLVEKRAKTARSSSRPCKPLPARA